MRYLIPLLIVSFLGCSDPETSGTPIDPDDASTRDASNANSGSDASANVVDMSGDSGAEPGDAGPGDASVADASRTVDSGMSDVGAADADRPDAGQDSGQADASVGDASQPDMARFECPNPKYNGQICTQVIVYVRDQESGTCCEYPTPCHIPDGNWGNVTYNSKSQCSTI